MGSDLGEYSDCKYTARLFVLSGAEVLNVIGILWRVHFTSFPSYRIKSSFSFNNNPLAVLCKSIFERLLEINKV